LNYGYSILEAEIRGDVNAVGLDSAIGFLHELTESKTPLIYDTQELFRWLVDLSVIQLLEDIKVSELSEETAFSSFYTDTEVYCCATNGKRIIAGDSIGMVHIPH
jgi:CRISPR/Cas system-associated endonuclease Cas1